MLRGAWVAKSFQTFVLLDSSLCLPPWDHRKSSHPLWHKLLDISGFHHLILPFPHLSRSWFYYVSLNVPSIISGCPLFIPIFYIQFHSGSFWFSVETPVVLNTYWACLPQLIPFRVHHPCSHTFQTTAHSQWDLLLQLAMYFLIWLSLLVLRGRGLPFLML